MSNHSTTLRRTTRHGNHVEFREHFHKLESTENRRNARVGRWDEHGGRPRSRASSNPWAARRIFLTSWFTSPQTPVNDGLVPDKVHRLGLALLNSFKRCSLDVPMKATRPRHFFRDVWPLDARGAGARTCAPARGILGEGRHSSPSSSAGDRPRWRSDTRVNAWQSRSPRPGLAAAILRQSWRDSPTSREPTPVTSASAESRRGISS